MKRIEKALENLSENTGFQFMHVFYRLEEVESIISDFNKLVESNRFYALKFAIQ